MARVTLDDLTQAAMWLEECDAGQSMREACLRVAAMLRQEADQREKEAAIRSVAREKGVSPAAVRKAMARRIP